MFLKYSVIIPTRNGLKYLKFAIQSVLQQSELDFELIVSDNHSTDGTWEYINSIKDPRLVCIQPEMPLSMVKHFEFVLHQPKGDWVSIIGDDDGLQPYFFELANELTKTYKNLSIINSARSFYYWEGCEAKYSCVVHYIGKYDFEIMNSLKAFGKLLFNNSKEYWDFPQFYTGSIFKRELLDTVRKKQNGIIFNSITPDANSVAIILKNTKKYIYSYIPLAWVGTSVKSTGFSSGSEEENVKTSANDFNNLNQKDQIIVNSKFPFLIEIFDMPLFFLEALYQNNKLYSPWLYRILDQYFIKHFVFFKVYINYCKIEKNNQLLGERYLNVFKANNLNLTLLSKLRSVNNMYKRFNSIINRIYNKLTHPVKKKKQAMFSIISENREEFPNMESAGKATNQYFKNFQKTYNSKVSN